MSPVRLLMRTSFLIHPVISQVKKFKINDVASFNIVIYVRVVFLALP